MALKEIKVNNTSVVKVDETPTRWSKNLVDSGGVSSALSIVPDIMNDETTAELNIGDESGNVLIELKDGHIKTKNFDSLESLKIMNDDSNKDLNIGDESGNVLIELKDGHIKTKNFNSRNSAGGTTPYTKLRFANWNITHFNMGSGITNVIDTQEEYEHYLPIYRNIFNQVNADFLSLCEFESPFFKNHSAYTTKKELFPNYQYYDDNSANSGDGDWIAYFSHLPLINVQVKDFA